MSFLNTVNNVNCVGRMEKGGNIHPGFTYSAIYLPKIYPAIICVPVTTMKCEKNKERT